MTPHEAWPEVKSEGGSGGQFASGPAGDEAKLFLHAANHFLADAELFLNLGVRQVGARGESFGKLRVEAQAGFGAPLPEIDVLDRHIFLLRGGRSGESQFTGGQLSPNRRLTQAR